MASRTRIASIPQLTYIELLQRTPAYFWELGETGARAPHFPRTEGASII